ncbi:MAG: FitA-like ribbon-helix-helix domain-containing protein [Acidobacteriota bacterium]
MPNLTVRNRSAEVHLAVRLRAARNGRSTEAEIRLILEQTVLPPQRLRIGSELPRIGREVGGRDDRKIKSYWIPMSYPSRSGKHPPGR